MYKLLHNYWSRLSDECGGYENIYPLKKQNMLHLDKYAHTACINCYIIVSFTNYLLFGTIKTDVLIMLL